MNALSFLPVGFVPIGLQCLKQSSAENSLPFTEYTENYFVNGMLIQNGRWLKPLLPMPEWNGYELTLDGKAITVIALKHGIGYLAS